MPTQPDMEAEKQAYLCLADEFNDPGVTDGPAGLHISDFDADYVERARRYAARTGLSFPPSVGDFDRAYENGLTR